MDSFEVVFFLFVLFVVLIIVSNVIRYVKSSEPRMKNKNRFASGRSNQSRVEDNYYGNQEQQAITPIFFAGSNDSRDLDSNSFIDRQENTLHSSDWIESREHSEERNWSSEYNEPDSHHSEHSVSVDETNWGGGHETSFSDTSYSSFDSGSNSSSTDSFSSSSSGSSD